MSDFKAAPDVSAASDFSAFFLSPTAPVDIELPTGGPMLFNGKQVRVNVYGPASAEFVAAADAQQRFIASRVTIKKGGGVKNTLDPEESHEQDAKFLAAVTASIDNFPYEGGPIAVYRERRLSYIADQVRAALNDQSSFFPGKAKG
jgi:hypothetical protein